MFLESPVARGSLSSNTTGASHVPTVNAIVPVGKVLVVRCITTSEPTVLTAGATNHHTACSDVSGNTWIKLGERTKDGSGSNISCTVSMWLCQVTVEIPNAGAITLLFDATYKSRLSGIVEFTLEVPEAVVALAGTNGASGVGSPLSVTTTLGAADEYTWLGAAGYGNRNYVVTKDAAFTTDLAEIEVEDTNFNSCTLWGQYRQVEIDTHAWSNTTPTGGIRWAMVLAAVTVTPPEPPPPEPGTREFQADFETDNHVVDGVSTARRPDGVSLDYRTSHAMGPVNVEDLSAGLNARVWRVRAEGTAVYLCRANTAGDDFDPEILLTTPAGAAVIDEIDLAFDENGRIVICAERATGSGGAAQVSLYWWNPAGITPGYEWKNVGTGRSPRVVCDNFPTTVAGPNVCPPEIDVQLFYIKSTGALVRIEQSSGFSTEVATPAPASSFTKIHRAFRTVDRRVSVLYSQRDLVTGRYAYKRLDSKPYNDSLLLRPSFINSPSPFNDLMQTAHLAWSDPVDQLTTDNWSLRVSTSQTVDAIELQARSRYPDGALPTWTDYTDSYAPGGGIGAGFFADFSVPLTHGWDADRDFSPTEMAYMSLVAFRARTMKVVLGVTCYSPWRYLIIPTSFPLVGDPSYDDQSVHCSRDVYVDIPRRLDFQRAGLVEGVRGSQISARTDPNPFVCTDGVAVMPPFYWFVGGETNTGPSFPFPTHVQNWEVRRRAVQAFDFTDEDGRYRGNVIGVVLETTSSGGPPDNWDWPSDQFGHVFPDDGGLVAPTPANIQIIEAKPDLLPL